MPNSTSNWQSLPSRAADAGPDTREAVELEPWCDYGDDLWEGDE